MNACQSFDNLRSQSFSCEVGPRHRQLRENIVFQSVIRALKHLMEENVRDTSIGFFLELLVCKWLIFFFRPVLVLARARIVDIEWLRLPSLVLHQPVKAGLSELKCKLLNQLDGSKVITNSVREDRPHKRSVHGTQELLQDLKKNTCDLRTALGMF